LPALFMRSAGGAAMTAVGLRDIGSDATTGLGIDMSASSRGAIFSKLNARNSASEFVISGSPYAAAWRNWRNRILEQRQP